MYCNDDYDIYKKKYIKNLKIELENLQFQLQQQKQLQAQFQAQLQRQEQNQAQIQNDTDTISNVGNPTININVDNCSERTEDRKKHYKEQNDRCSGYNKNEKQHNDSCCNYINLERQVNNSASDVTNFPRITQSETSLAHFKDFILYGFNDSNNAIGGPGNFSFSGFSFSNDLGKTWTDGGSLPVNRGGLNVGDPVITVDRNGVFYYGQVGTEDVPGSIRQDVISISTGTITPSKTITMNRPQIVGRGQNPPPVDNPDTILQDKEWITVGSDADNPGNEALYVTWTDFTTPTTSILFSKYTTGVNLTPIITDQVIVPPAVNTFVSGSFVLVDDLGGIYVFYEQITDPNPADMIPPQNNLNTPNRTIRMVKSVDGGNTFPINVPVSIPFAAAATTTDFCGRPSIGVDNTRRIRTNDFPHAAIAPDETLYVVWNAGRAIGATTFIDVFLAYSTDKGNTWHIVDITPKDITYSFFPSVAANKDGAHIQYNRFNDRGGSIGGVGDGTFAIFMKSFSICDGLSKEKMVSTAFSPVPITIANPDPIPSRCYMGDYNQIISGPGNCLLHSWGDNRNVLNGQINPDVFFNITIQKKKDHNCGCN
ncbi:sialidase family protein [Bacillus wiedmannii]|uniref:sialidase family protein n=1 Tax=Bacillus wiedmannii TaxID=1890302 RepID=UPI001F0AD91A|nr:sialidase family protein [Bacillus wiedmannii]